MNDDMIVRVIEKIVVPKGEPIFSERATTIRIVDEATGEFLKVVQDYDDMEAGTICIDRDEWPLIKKTIDEMIESLQD